MLKQIINTFSLDNVTHFISLKLSSFEDLLNQYFSHSANIKLLSVVMMAIGGILFLFWLAIVIAKYLGLAANEAAAQSQQKRRQEKNMAAKQAAEDESIENEHLFEEEAEREEDERSRKAAEELIRAELEKKMAEEKQQVVEKQRKEIKAAAEKKDNILDLDWKKGKLANLESMAEKADISANLKYQQSKKQLSELLGLIVDMLGRNVDGLKIAQTIMYRNMNQNSEDDILQTVDAVKDFIALCINKKFDKLISKNKLPKIEEALYHLANGDTSYALALIETLMDNNIEAAAALPNGEKRNEIFAVTSNYATIFGTLAAVSDVHLATGAFELAIELAPQNINAWSRAGDMYQLSDAESKAIWAYTNVLNLSDNDLNERQTANANKMLSQYYYKQGNSLQAAKLYNSSRGYYDSIGINRNLDRQEIEIVRLIEDKQKEKLQDTIIAVLNNKKLAQYSFA